MHQDFSLQKRRMERKPRLLIYRVTWDKPRTLSQLGPWYGFSWPKCEWPPQERSPGFQLPHSVKGQADVLEG